VGSGALTALSPVFVASNAMPTRRTVVGSFFQMVNTFGICLPPLMAWVTSNSTLGVVGACGLLCLAGIGLRLVCQHTRRSLLLGCAAVAAAATAVVENVDDGGRRQEEAIETDALLTSSIHHGGAPPVAMDNHGSVAAVALGSHRDWLSMPPPAAIASSEFSGGDVSSRYNGYNEFC
jgi:hypothetical protein